MADHHELLSPTKPSTAFENSELALCARSCRYTAILIPFLAALRGILALELLVAPQWACHFMRLEAHPTATILPRLVGARELAIAILTWISYKNYTTGRSSAANLRAVLLWGNILVDSIDVLTCVVAVMTSPSEMSAGALLCASGSFAVVLGFLGFRSIR
jgi:hypothetical protein